MSDGAAASRPTISVSIAWSRAARQVRSRQVSVPAGSTVADALRVAGKTADNTQKLGIWGRKTTLDHVLQEGDRIELYRPLLIDPKVARRERFKSQGAKTAGLFAKRRPGSKPGY